MAAASTIKKLSPDPECMAVPAASTSFAWDCNVRGGAGSATGLRAAGTVLQGVLQSGINHAVALHACLQVDWGKVNWLVYLVNLSPWYLQPSGQPAAAPPPKKAAPPPPPPPPPPSTSCEATYSLGNAWMQGGLHVNSINVVRVITL